MLDDGSTWTEHERALASRGELRALDETLQRRIEQASGEERGRLRRRRAIQLAQGDKDLAGACDELERLLAERASPDIEVLGQLARWLEARGDHVAAGERWLELLELTPNGEQASLVAVRASEAYLEAKDFARARSALDRIGHLPPTAEVVLMQLALANANEDDELFDFPRVAVEQSQSLPTTDASWRNFGVASPEDALRLEDLKTTIARRPEASSDLVDEDEIAFLEEELDDGEWAAGQHLASIYAANLERFDKKYLSVRHRQAVLMPGAQGPLEALLTAARACRELWYADAVEHVLDTFHGRAVRTAPALGDVTEAPQALAKLLFGDLEGTVCDALALACRGGLLRENDDSASLSEQEEVRLDSGTFVARVVAAMTRRLPLEGVKVFARASDEPAHHRVVLRAPLCVVISGALTESPQSAYAIGSALAAATSPCAYSDALDEGELDVLVRALLAAFGPVPEEPGRIAEPLFAQLTQDLWSVVLGADERRVRDLCYESSLVSPGLARNHAGRARRRTGLFACGDLPTALEATAAELGLWSSYPHGDSDGLRNLCTHPSLANLVELALDPTYARLRWMRVPGPPSSPRMR
jgi:tetratricopeptide (TPR) repeat protein